MGLQPLALIEAAFGGGPLLYAGDACGAIAALAPGHGELGRELLRQVMTRQKPVAVVFRPWAALGEHEVVAGLRGVRTIGG